MPGFDGMGPVGRGAMTGGGRGRCAVALNGANANSGNNSSFYCRGAGRGSRNCFYATGLPGWVRAQKGMRAFGRFGCVISREEK